MKPTDSERAWAWEQTHLLVEPDYRTKRQRRYRAKHPRASADAMTRFRAAHRSLEAQVTGVSQLEKDYAPLAVGAVAQYRLPLDGVRRTADFAWPDERVAVFIDGDWWHGCPTHVKGAKTNTAYWAAKVAGNKARDLDTDARLAAIGWTSLRLWECQVRELLRAKSARK